VAIAVGSRLGPYEVVSLLGAGGMGEVYRARDTRLDRDVAIKVLPDAVAADPDRRRRFEQEARAIAALNHPHVCQIYDVGPTFLVLEYVDGAPIVGPMSVDAAGRVSLQIARALEMAHARGILHRDLKPTNVLLTSTGDTKLLDFGLVKLLQASDGADDVTRTAAGTIVGTAAYMSPEQAEGRTVDARSDVFSFGAVLYELLSGARAFSGETTAQVLSALLRDSPRPLPVSPLTRIVTRCLEKDPALRYQAMAEVRAALEDVVRGQPDRDASIAVLPFADMSPAKDNEYFSDGLAEEIINSLAHSSHLKIIARTSAFAFKGQNVDIRRIAETLGVTHVLEGSVRKAGNRIRATAQLINAVDGSHLWSERYDREVEDVFAVQDEIATAIAAALRVKLSPAPRHHVNVAAYESYLKGRHHWARLTPDALARSRACYEEAVALDPRFALARFALAEHFYALTANGLKPSRDIVDPVRKWALEALDVDPTFAEPHALLGLLAASVLYDWPEAANRFHLAMTREPVTPWVRWFHGQYLMQIGRLDEAVDQMQRTLQEDPLHVLCRSQMAGCLHAFGRRAEASRQLEQVFEIDRDFWVARWYEGLTAALDGDLLKARAAAEQAYSLTPHDKMNIGLLAGVLSRTGDSPRAEGLLTELQRGDGHGVPLGTFMYHFARLEQDPATAWLEKAIDEHEQRVMYVLPYMRTKPGWPALAKKLGASG
jgi:serine/threonine protein kinase/tetratricopeptide (TPR) repeat protein